MTSTAISNAEPTSRWRRALALAVCLFASACSLPVADKESDGLARTFYDEMRSGADLSRDPHLSPAVRAAAAATTPDQLRAQIPAGPWTKINVTGWNFNSSSETGASATLGHDYVYPKATVHVMTGLHKEPGQTAWTIVGFRAIADGSPQPALVLGAMPQVDSSSN
ncbi:MAG TPA: hypothetical protein VGI95_09605 [Caulobacteraceae bacterium]|jgi:hypothetical protein